MIVSVLGESVARRLREQNFKVNASILGCKMLTCAIGQNKPNCKSRHIYRQDYREGGYGACFKVMVLTRPRCCNVNLTVSDLCRADCPQQLDFSKSAAKEQKTEKRKRMIDQIRRRFGYFAISRGTVLQDKHLTGLNPKRKHAYILL